MSIEQSNRIPSLEKASFFAALAAAFLFSFPREFMNFGYVIWMIVWTVEIIFRKNIRFEKPSKSNLHLYLLLAYFAWFIISLFWTTNYQEAQVTFERRISLLIFPILALFGVSKHFKLKTFLYFFLFGAIVSITIHLISTIHSFRTEEVFFEVKQSFYDAYVSHYKHRTFFSICMIVASIIFAYLKDDLTQKIATPSYWAINILLNTAFLLYIYNAGGRMALIIYMLVIVVRVAYYLWMKKQKIIMLIAVTSLLLALGFLLSMHPRMKSIELNKASLEQFDPRYAMWSSSIGAIQDNVILGAGIGDRKDVFTSYYDAYPCENKRPATSTHNNFIDNQLELGIVGSILLLGILFSAIRGVNRKNALIIVSLSLTWILLSSIESTGSTTSIYVFMLYLLLIKWLKEKEQSEILLNSKLIIKPLLFISIYALFALSLLTTIWAMLYW